jgi:tetratricopeptide (TPR) repeat protein
MKFTIPVISSKKIFYALAGLFLILLPLLSLKSGISGDEETFHYPHGKNVFNYYATFGKDTTCLHYSNSVLHMYGPVFDLATVAVIKVFHVEDEYQVRHIMNALAGWSAVLCAGLIAVLLGGWRAGILTMILMFLSPRFLGHSFNNPKDIPFAAAYIFTIYSIIRYLKYYPEKRIRFAWPVALGIGLTIGVRVGGILLAVYFLFFTGLYYLLTHQIKNWFKSENLNKLATSLLYAFVISLAGYIIGIILWPYAHKAPVEKTLEAMKFMEAYATSLRQLFEGKIIWSDNVPAYYLPKYIFMTVPEFIILGLVCFFVFIKSLKKEDGAWYFILLFVSVFPVFYIIIKGSNVYGGWRHVSFIYPALVVIASLGIVTMLGRVSNKYFRWSIVAVITALVILPLRHIIVNHPMEYIYYNTVSGGMKNAYGKYEMDYFYHSLRPGSEWLIENKINKASKPEGEKIVVATNLSTITKYYFRHLQDQVQVVYIRYYERGNSNWDYAILANSYINPYQLKRRIWPPANTIHTIDVDGKPVCAILERKDRNDYLGSQKLASGDPAAAISYFNEALKSDPKYEMVYYNLAKVYMDLRAYDEVIKNAGLCLKYYPGYNRALSLMGMAYLNNRQPENAMDVFRQNMRLNPKDVSSYYYAGVIYAESKNFKAAIDYLEQAIQLDGRYKPSYYLLSQIYQMQGNEQVAKQLINYVNSLP